MKKNIEMLLFALLFGVLDIVMMCIIDFSVIRIIFLIHIYVCVHEFSHMIAYMVQGIEVYSITIFPIKIYYDEKIKVKFDGFRGYLGLVIPKINDVSKDRIERYRTKVKYAIIAAVYSNFFLFLFYLLLNFVINDIVIIMSMLINLSMFIMAMTKTDYVSGDIVAYNNIRKNIKYYYLYMYTFHISNDVYNREDRKAFIKLFESVIVWSEYDVDTKKILYNIFEEQSQLEELCISKDFIEKAIVNSYILIEEAKKKKYIDYAICNKLILVLLKYQYSEEAKQLYDRIKDIFPINALQIESKIRLGVE